ncbi:hypothetical protein CGK74_10825 [Thauera propionica]|uniref:GGDEF domain-containing protein n=1 Tax=Thauera propionica TaxID=2019431 RepID=A0A235EXH2_9RHOO|nr:EAL domain-containing protein [Thauera propionica]OYD53714.1 hypothetical protein CGK74_10825 [Thauera propionica]
MIALNLDHAGTGKAPRLLGFRHVGGLVVFCALLHFTARYNYLLFHTLVETIRIVVLGSIFVLAWNSRRWVSDGFLLIVGIGSICVAALEILHTLSFKGLNLFPGYDANLPTQLWIAFRYLEGAAFLAALYNIGRPVRADLLLTGGSLLTLVLGVLIFSGNFPDCYIEGSGLTPFKIVSEFVLIGIFSACAGAIYVQRHHFAPSVARLLIAAMLTAALADFAFTSYAGVFDAANEFGHYLLFISSFLLYRAVLVAGIASPFDLLFRSLKQKESELEAKVAERTAALRKSQALNRAVVENSPAVIYLTDIDRRYTLANAAFERLIGKPRKEILGRTAFDLFPQNVAFRLDRRNHNVIATNQPLLETEEIRTHLDSDTRLFKSVHFPLLDEHGQVVGMGGIATDITDSQIAEERYGAIIRSSMDAFMMVDESANLLEVNDAACELSGYSRGQLSQMSVADLDAAVDKDTLMAVMRRIAREGSSRFDSRWRRKDGELRDVEVSVQYLLHGGAPRYYCFVRDISGRKAAAARIEYLAHHDLLTALPNKLLFQQQCREALLAAERDGRNRALVYLDLDDFKAINDTLGHAVGDELLRELAARVRTLIGEHDLACRVGGDEFLMLVGDANDQQRLAAFAERTLAALAEPVQLDSTVQTCTASIGIARFPEDGADFDTLYRKADTAMSQAKAAGRNIFRFFDEAMHAQLVERRHLLALLRGALERDELRLHYQPQIDLHTGTVIGAEALIRWQHPELGMVSPARFIPIAEESGLIVPIGTWVMREACRQAKAWQDAGLPHFVVAVNLSAVQFRRPDFCQTVANTLADTGLPPGCLELELTESLLINDADGVLETVRQLKALGLQLSIDDFGTGYSSLAYLKRFDVDKLKIDQSFVRDMDRDADSAALVLAIVQMAHSLGLKTIAEGVEHDHLAAVLRGLNCDEAQGYHFARPMPAADIEGWLRSAVATRMGR